MSAESQIQGKKKNPTHEVLVLRLKCFRSLIQSVSLFMLILFTQLDVDSLKKRSTLSGCDPGCVPKATDTPALTSSPSADAGAVLEVQVTHLKKQKIE